MPQQKRFRQKMLRRDWTEPAHNPQKPNLRCQSWAFPIYIIEKAQFHQLLNSTAREFRARPPGQGAGLGCWARAWAKTLAQPNENNLPLAISQAQ